MSKPALAVVGHIGPEPRGDRLSLPHALAALAALGQPTRLAIFRLLMAAEPKGLPAGDIAQKIGCPHNTLSSHLSVLARSGPRARRARRPLHHLSRGGRRHPHAGRLPGQRMLRRPSGTVRPARRHRRELRLRAREKETEQVTMREPGNNKPYNVLFLCTGNSARSVIAESVLNRAGQGNFRAFSAGSHPKGQVHPYTLDLLRKMHFDVGGLRSKSWLEFAQPGAPKLDFVFTVCDDAAGETCPVWPGQPMTAHWGVPDPAAATGTEAEIRFAFADTLRMLTNRINIFASLPLAKLDRLSLQKRLDDIGAAKDDAAPPATAAE